MSKKRGGMSAKAAAEVLENGEVTADVVEEVGSDVQVLDGGVVVASRAKPAANIASFIASAGGGRRAKLMTLPSLVMKTIGEGRMLRFDSAMRISDVIDPRKKDQKPATVANVTDMQTGEPFIFLVPTVVKSNLERAMPDEGYVGEEFAILNVGQRQTGANKYHEFSIAHMPCDE